MFNRKKRYYNFAMKEENVTTFISTLQTTGAICSHVGHESDMWFVIFDATKKEYRNLMIELCKIGTLTIDEANVYFTKK